MEGYSSKQMSKTGTKEYASALENTRSPEFSSHINDELLQQGNYDFPGEEMGMRDIIS